MSTNDTFLAVFLGSKNSAKWAEWNALSETERKAREEYGVVLTGPKLEVDRRATDELRESMRRNRKAPKLFDFGERRANASTRAVAMV